MKNGEKASISLYVLIACTFFVTILFALYNNVLNKAKFIEQGVKQIQENYSMVINDTTSIVAGKTYDNDTIININGEKVSVPGGATVSKFFGEYEDVNEGIVIYIMKDADGDGKIDTPNWSDKTKMQTTYDQFVWVPVKDAVLDLSNSYSNLDEDSVISVVQTQVDKEKYPMAIKINTDGDYVGILYQFTEGAENGNQYVKVSLNESWTPKSNKYKEPSAVSADILDNLNQVNGILDTDYSNTSNFEKELQREYNEMVSKVEETGGFWIARYETSNMSNTTTTSYDIANRRQVSSKKNTTNGISDVTWYRMYAQQRLYSEMALGDKTTRISSMIWGSQWDQIMIWMKDVESSTQSQSKGKYYVINGTGKGNYGTISGIEDGNTNEDNPASTGSQDMYSVKNIFDLAGNLIEYTLETGSSDYRIERGGNYSDKIAESIMPSYRYLSNTNLNYISRGSRFTIY